MTFRARHKLFDQIDFRLDDTEADVLGDAYEYLIGQIASGAGRCKAENARATRIRRSTFPLPVVCRLHTSHSWVDDVVYLIRVAN